MIVPTSHTVADAGTGGREQSDAPPVHEAVRDLPALLGELAEGYAGLAHRHVVHELLARVPIHGRRFFFCCIQLLYRELSTNKIHVRIMNFNIV